MLFVSTSRKSKKGFSIPHKNRVKRFKKKGISPISHQTLSSQNSFCIFDICYRLTISTILTNFNYVRLPFNFR